jgi:hypothetical protein
MTGQRPTFVDDAGRLVEDCRDGGRISFVGCGEQLGQRVLRRDAVGDGAFEGDPAFVTAFACEGILNVAKRDLVWRVGIGADQAGARIGLALAKRFQPALCRRLEIIEGGQRRLLPLSA